MTPWEEILQQAVEKAMQKTGGAGLVFYCLTLMPGKEEVEVRTGWFGKRVETQLGNHRYYANSKGQLICSHIVEGIAISARPLTPKSAGEHIVADIKTLLEYQSAEAGDEILAVAEGLSAALV